VVVHMSQGVYEPWDLMTFRPPPLERLRRFNVTHPTSNDLGPDCVPIIQRNGKENLTWESAGAYVFGFLVLPQGTGR